MDYSGLRRISLYIVILLQCFASSHAHDVDECSPRCWTVQQNASVPYSTGHRPIGIESEENCKSLCLNTEMCIGLDWDINNDIAKCWLQTTTASIDNNRPGINHWTVADCTGDCAPYCWKDVQANVHVIESIFQLDINDESQCKLRCSKTKDCTGIDWHESHDNTKWCYLIYTDQPHSTTNGMRHWDIERSLSTICQITTEMSTAAADIPTTIKEIPTTIKEIPTTVTTPHAITTEPLKSTTESLTITKTFASEASTSNLILSETSPPTTAANQSDSSGSGDSNNTAAIIGGVVGIFCGLALIIILLVVIIMFARKRQRNGQKLKETSDTISLDGDDKKNRPTVPRKPMLPTMRSGSGAPSTGPVSLARLSSQFASPNFMDNIKQEFDSLPSANYDVCSAAKGSEDANKKNRFKNILPYDATRVKLLGQGNGSSDYINANYIQGFDGVPKAYIASQGPLKTTLNDFWQMIWNDGLNRIVMITHLTEQGKSKCDKYWPDGVNGSKEYNKITVTLVECHICTDYTRRVMRMEHKEYKETRLVTQLHFTIWNDKGIPTEVYPLLAFRKRVRSLDEKATGPMLVHCSAGVGRTGTFIALDCLLEQAEKTDQVSVFGVVKKLREQRMNMVQVADQYKLLYEAVLEAKKTGATDFDRRSFKRILSTADVNQNLPESLKTSSEFEYKLLEDIKRRKVAMNRMLTGHQPENLNKNRYAATIPDDRIRIYLLPTFHESDYINAVVTQGHRCPGHYILTQLPLKETIVDFWRMVTEHNCPTIVVLVPPHECDEFPYWPSEDRLSLQFGKISVSLTSKVAAGEILGLELQLSRSGSAPQIVHLYRLSNWNLNDELPGSATDVLDLIGIVSDRHQQLMNTNDDAVADIMPKDRKPAVIICPDGANKSGLFVAASYLIDKMKNDRLVDAYLSSRYVVSARPQAIASLAQYQYIFRLAIEHLHWTKTITMDFAAGQLTEETYANANQSSSDVDQPIYENS